MSDANTSEEFRRQVSSFLREEKEAERQSRYQGLSDDTLAWLALVPAWSIPLADACGFPGAKSSQARQLFEVLMERGIMELVQPEHRAGPTSQDDNLYIMTDSCRAEVLNSFLGTAGEQAPRSATLQDSFIQRIVGIGPQGENIPKGIDYLRRIIVELGERITQVNPRPSGALDLVTRWARLARLGRDSGELVNFFDEEVDASFRERDTGGILSWIEAARPLAALLAHDTRDRDQLAVALGRAGRRMELLHRRKVDARHLEDYFRRADLVSAFNDLMDGPDELWALHYLGPGGVGKTMFVRDLTAYLTGEANPLETGCDDPQALAVLKSHPEVATARIDFDYLSADYPRLAPGLLLWALTQELRAYDPTGRANRLFDKADRLLEDLRQEISSDPLSKVSSVTSHPTFRQAIEDYIDAFHQLGRRILLIVDTCEELAKTHRDEAASDNILETFRILRALHDGPQTLIGEAPDPARGLPDLRVVFSGRRPLASGGHFEHGHHRWVCETCRLPPRDYLRLCEVQGFTLPEAQAFLACEEVPQELIGPVIQASSPDVGTSVQIRYTQQVRVPEEISRCNPYKLSLFLDWAKEPNPPSPGDIARATSTAYIKIRLIDRLRDPPLEALLPAAALLGHMDSESLRVAAGLASAEFEPVFHRLMEQEWIDQSYSPPAIGEEPRLVLHIERGVRDGLLAYFEQRGDNLDALRGRAAAHLQRFILDTDLSRLHWSDFDAALRVSQVEPRDAASWWEKVEARLLVGRDPEWVLETIGILLEKDGAARARDPLDSPETPPENRLRPVVLVTQAEALLRSGNSQRLHKIWSEVSEKISQYSDSAACRRFWLRALAGIISVPDYSNLQSSNKGAVDFWKVLFDTPPEVLNLEMASVLVAACEGLVEVAELSSRNPLENDQRESAQYFLKIPSHGIWNNIVQNEQVNLGPLLLAEWLYQKVMSRTEDAAPGISKSAIDCLLAYMYCLSARTLLLIGDSKSLDYFNQALELVRKGLSSEPAVHWYGWLPPANLPARVHLEFARLACPAFLSPTKALQMLGTGQGTPEDLDSERLHSARLRLMLADGPVPLEDLSRLGWVDVQGKMVYREVGLSAGVAVCNAHWAVPPLFASVAEAFAAMGQVEAAVRQLRYITNQTGLFDTTDIRQAELQLLRILRRWRLLEEGEQVIGSMTATAWPWEDRWFYETLYALDDPEALVRATEPVLTASEGYALAVPSATHLAWQTRLSLGDVPASKILAEWLQPTFLEYPGISRLINQPAESMDFWSASIRLDLLELYLITSQENAYKNPETREFFEIMAKNRFDLDGWQRAHPYEPEQALTLHLRNIALSGGVLKSDAILDVLAQQIGSRRAAEIALDAGELLALRRIGGDFLFEQALKWFKISGDAVGAVIAGTASCLASLYNDMGAQNNILSKISFVEEQYLALNSGLGLPAWNTLERLAASPSNERLDQLRPFAWRPWLTRLVAALLSPTKVTDTTSPAAALFQWVETNYSLIKDDRVLVPAEWRLWGLHYNLPPKPRPTEAGGLSRRALYFIIGGVLAVLMGLLLGGFFLLRWLTGKLIDISGLALGWQILLYLLELILIIAGVALFGNFRSYWSSRGKLTVDIETLEASKPPEAQTVFVRMTHWQRRLDLLRFPPTYFEAKRFQASHGQLTGSTAYVQLPENLSAAMRQELVQLHHQVRRRTLQVAIRPDANSHGPCWEAMLALAVKDQSLTSPFGLAFYFRRLVTQRTSQISAGEPAATKPPPMGQWQLPSGTLRVSSLVSGVVARAVAQNAWNRLPRIEWNEEFPFAAPGSPVVLHLIGAVEERKGRLRLRLETGEAYQSHTRAIEQANIQKGEYLFSAVELRRAYPGVQLCILHGELETSDSRQRQKNEIQPPAGVRLENERRSTSLARAFAAELTTQGIPVVLVLPTLETSLSTETLRVIAKGCAPGSGLLQLQRTIRAAQELIAKPGDDAAWERAFDICLYIAEVSEVARPREQPVEARVKA